LNKKAVVGLTANGELFVVVTALLKFKRVSFKKNLHRSESF
jgi:hypothetical protein